ncbi:MAG: deoxyribonuclease IV [Bryobacteraceae bacterium]
MRIGIHTNSQGSLEKTARKAHELGANTFQIFSASPKMWRAVPPAAADALAMRRVREQLDLTPLVIHDNYLINLASADAEVRAKSVAAFRGELERAAIIGAEYLVAHPGSYKGQTLEQGLLAFVEGLVEATGPVDPGGVTLLLECTAGSGNAIGSRLEELHALREVAQNLVNLPIGFCLDTCHLLVAGFDIATEKGLKETVDLVGAVLGWEHVKVIHSNDSKGALGSRLDRHENIGKGQIGIEGFRRIVQHARLRTLPFILETPVESDEDARRDIETLRSLCQRSRTTISRSR